MSASKVFRGSWIPAKETAYNMIFFCPFCLEAVYMGAGSPTYPTCPWCLSDMPEAEDFETPEELKDAKRGNRNATGSVYNVSREDNERMKADRRRRYWSDPEGNRERSRKYAADPEHHEKKLQRDRRYYQENRDLICAKARERREKDRDEINAKRRERYRNEPERFLAYRLRARGRPTEEIEANIRRRSEGGERMSGQIKSRERVTKFGEVFTAPREVNAMLDLVKPETEKVGSRFLEPACGDGAFLVEILRRKLESAKKLANDPTEFEELSVRAVESIYGIDFQTDNVGAARERLWELWFTTIGNPDYELQERVRNALLRNIVCGDFLTGLTIEGEPIWFLKEAVS